MLNIFEKAKHPVIFFPEGHNTYILIKQFLMTGCLLTKKFIQKKYIAGVFMYELISLYILIKYCCLFLNEKKWQLTFNIRYILSNMVRQI